MIWNFLIAVVISILGYALAIFPTVTELPWGVDETLSSGVAYYKNFAELFPPLNLLLELALLYLGYRLLMIVLKVILGSRTPSL